MFKNYIKIAWRNLLKNKAFTAINILGLAIGITCSALILLWVEDEVNYDSSFSNKEHIYYVPTNQIFDGETYTIYATPGPLAKDLKDNIPGIDKSSITFSTSHMLSIDDKALNRTGRYVDPDFIDMFSLEFLEGEVTNALATPDAIVLTKRTANTLFGEGVKALNETIKINNEFVFTVKGVVADLPSNTTFKFDWLLPSERLILGEDNMSWAEQYGNNFADTFVMLDANADFASVDKKVREWIPSQMEGGDTTQAIAFLHALKDWNLRSSFTDGKITGGKITLVKTMLFIAFIILCIACINFMNLSTAKSEKRAGEVGVRKVLGSTRNSLVYQFMFEALIMAALGAVLSLVIVASFLPSFNILVEKQLELNLLENGWQLGILGIITMFCGVLAGWYPALYLSSFKPSQVLKGIYKKGKVAGFIRKGLVIGQFAVSVVFIIATIIIYQQVQHTKERDMGYDIDALVRLSANGNTIKNFNAIRADLMASNQIENASLTNSDMLSEGFNGSGLRWQGGTDTEDILVRYRYVTPDFFNTVGLTIIEGHGFSQNQTADSTNILVNESFAKLMGEGSAIGKTVNRWGGEYNVVGIVNDYRYGNVYGSGNIGPMMYYHIPDFANHMYVKVSKEASLSDALATIENVMKKYNPAFPFEYSFEEDAFNTRFYSEELVGKLARIFSILTILISCLGLFGLSAFMAEQRKKEIGVRKVLGASVSRVISLLSKDFLQLVIVALLIATPLSYWLMNDWLQAFAYRIDISLWVFAIAGFLAIAIALTTISFQAIKAASANPIKSLRTE